MHRDVGVAGGRHEQPVEAPLAPAPQAVLPISNASDQMRQPPPAWCAHAIAKAARGEDVPDLIYVATNERRADEIGRALRVFAPEREVQVLEPWDCLPYDRASPSREVMGRRMSVLARLSRPGGDPRILVVPIEGLLQRVPPKPVLGDAFLTLRCGESLDRAALQAFAARVGYVVDDRIDEPGEIAILGAVIDVFPAAAPAPVRIGLDENDKIVEIRRYDPLTQRSEESVDAVQIGPASELILRADDERSPGAEHRAAEFYGKLSTVLEFCPDAALAFDPRALARAGEFLEQVSEAYEARRSLGEADGERALPPTALYLTLRSFRSAISKRRQIAIDATRAFPIPHFASAQNPGRAFSDHVSAALAANRRVVLTGMPHELRAVSRAIKRGLERSPEPITEWTPLVAAGAAGLFAFEADIDTGFSDPPAQLEVIAAADVLGGRVAVRRSNATETPSLLSEPDLRVGDVVIHEDHGLGVLTALERIEADGEERDALRISYQGDADLLAPVDDIDRIWRYGAEPDAVTLDRLNSDAWTRRRAALSADIEQTAAELVERARARAAAKGAVIRPPKARYARLAARFPYPETQDQASAIDAVLHDLASGRVMNRLVCGDVGFGKTEVALRAATAVALSGRQVALIAPTTVLARQHYESVRRRFSGTDIQVARLSRLAGANEARAVKAGLAEGAIHIVVGTQALLATDVAFKELGLLIVDEEQRFGAGLKAQLRAMAPSAHRLTLTATPIPRTLQLAMVGLEDVSIIATPPARRRPIRTFLAPYDPATVATALRRERRRGGQSFVVAPRIQDLAPLADEIRQIAPELTIGLAHGEMPADDLDEIMVGFAAGEGDVLLATNIIESGLDVPRANTMLVTRADMFGLAQLHQLRGRVGRGRVQGVTYLFHAPDVDLPETTRARLMTLEAFDRLGSGLAISARDLELRGAGDLLGDEQAGHLKLIGTALYQRLLSRAVAVAKGELDGPEWTPQLNLGVTGSIPETYVPDATLRINLYSRLARLDLVEDVDQFAEELEDRFGALVLSVERLLQAARIRALARVAGIGRIDAGPKAIAFTPSPGRDAARLAKAADLTLSGERLLWRGNGLEGDAQLLQTISVLSALISS